MNAVVGVKDADGLIKTKAFIVLNDGISPSESIAVSIKKYAKKNLSPHKYPRFIEFVSELPLTRTGKINRRKLKKQGV
jgi:benzoate-CoA ligase